MKIICFPQLQMWQIYRPEPENVTHVSRPLSSTSSCLLVQSTHTSLTAVIPHPQHTDAAQSSTTEHLPAVRVWSHLHTRAHEADRALHPPPTYTCTCRWQNHWLITMTTWFSCLWANERMVKLEMGIHIMIITWSSLTLPARISLKSLGATIPWKMKALSAEGELPPLEVMTAMNTKPLHRLLILTKSISMCLYRNLSTLAVTPTPSLILYTIGSQQGISLKMVGVTGFSLQRVKKWTRCMIRYLCHVLCWEETVTRAGCSVLHHYSLRSRCWIAGKCAKYANQMYLDLFSEFLSWPLISVFRNKEISHYNLSCPICFTLSYQQHHNLAQRVNSNMKMLLQYGIYLLSSPS